MCINVVDCPLAHFCHNCVVLPIEGTVPLKLGKIDCSPYCNHVTDLVFSKNEPYGYHGFKQDCVWVFIIYFSYKIRSIKGV